MGNLLDLVRAVLHLHVRYDIVDDLLLKGRCPRDRKVLRNDLLPFDWCMLHVHHQLNQVRMDLAQEAESQTRLLLELLESE